MLSTFFIWRYIYRTPLSVARRSLFGYADSERQPPRLSIAELEEMAELGLSRRFKIMLGHALPERNGRSDDSLKETSFSVLEARKPDLPLYR